MVGLKCPYYLHNLKKVAKDDLKEDYGKNKYILNEVEILAGADNKPGNCALFLPSCEDGVGLRPKLGQGTSPLWGLGQRPKVLKPSMSANLKVQLSLFFGSVFSELFFATLLLPSPLWVWISSAGQGLSHLCPAVSHSGKSSHRQYGGCLTADCPYRDCAISYWLRS
ncbi:MAG: hypothetical protein E7244_13390 [Enterocloster citroniae]|nr:hypothetical protein [Enterocloster citroniae]